MKRICIISTLALLLAGCSRPAEQERVAGALAECQVLLDAAEGRIQTLEKDIKQHQSEAGSQSELNRSLGSLMEAQRQRDIVKSRIIQLAGDTSRKKQK